MIRFLLLHNKQGKTRLSKWYIAVPEDERLKTEAEIHRIVATRSAKLANVVEYQSYKIIYKQYAGLVFSMCIDPDDNELAHLEAIHMFVELLDKYFGNVCELDLVFNFHKVYTILNEFVCGGEILETSQTVMMARMHEFDKLLANS